MKKILLLITFICLSLTTYAFDFVGWVKDINNNPVGGANVSLVSIGPGGSPPQFWSALTDANGYFNVSNINESVPNLKLSIVNYSNGVATLMSKILPPFPYFMYQYELSNKTFYLQDAATINITAINASAQPTLFQGMLMDSKYNFPISEFVQPQFNKLVPVPVSDLNYTLIFWSSQSPARSIKINMNGVSKGEVKNVIANTTTNLYFVTGYLKDESGSLINTSIYDFTDMVIYNYISSFVPLDAIIEGLPKNISSKNDFAWYNISLPGPDVRVLITAYANKTGVYYGSFKDLTINQNTELNLTLYPLAGIFDSSGKVNTSKMTFNIFYTNGTHNLSAGNSFIDILVNYSSTITRFTFDTNENGTGKIPLRNDTSIKVTVFNHRFPPREFEFTPAQLQAPYINITLTGFNMMMDPDGNLLQGMSIQFYKSNPICDVINPPSECLLFDMSASNPEEGIKVLLLPGKVSLRLTHPNGIVVHYIDVDLIASGPPDVSPDTVAQTIEAGATLTNAWRFGSLGPKVYDRIIIGIPYNASEVDEIHAPAPKVVIPQLYDNNWNVVWNASVDDLADLPSEYSDFDYTWFTSGISCSKTDVNANCYMDTTNNMIWLRIPHFSGLGPQVQAYANLGNITSDRTIYSCYPSCTALINLTMSNSDLVGYQNITVNNTADNPIGIIYKIEWLNTSTWKYEGDNETTYEYNLTLGLHRFRINITLSEPLSTKWNFTLLINGTPYTLDPYIDSINLSTPEDNALLPGGSRDFKFTLFSETNPTQNCTLYINGVSTGLSTIATNGTLATITKDINSSDSSWKISCNVTGDSETRVMTVDDQSPVITIASEAPKGYYKITGFDFNFTVTDNIGITECNLTINGVVNKTITNVPNGTKTNITVENFADGTYQWNITCQDNVSNIAISSTYIFVVDTVKPIITSIGPTGTQTSSTGTISVTLFANTNENSTCRYSTSDINYLNMTSTMAKNAAGTYHTASLSFSEDGTHTYYIRCVDRAGNIMTFSNSTSFSVDITETTTTAGRGGGGNIIGATTTPTERSLSWSVIAKGAKTILNIKSKEISITRLIFTLNRRVILPSIKVKAIDKPAQITTVPKNSYKFLEISKQNIKDADIESATIDFKVENSWITSKGINKLSISLYRYVNNNWQELTTTFIKSDTQYSYYKAETSGFSYFVIAEGKGKALTAFDIIDIIREFYAGISKYSAFEIIDIIRTFYGG